MLGNNCLNLYDALLRANIAHKNGVFVQSLNNAMN
jgi:hypothetical protein